MTLEEFYAARALDTREFIHKLESDLDFEKEYYDWVDYLTVASIQEKTDLEPSSKLASNYKRSYQWK